MCPRTPQIVGCTDNLYSLPLFLRSAPTNQVQGEDRAHHYLMQHRARSSALAQASYCIP